MATAGCPAGPAARHGPAPAPLHQGLGTCRAPAPAAVTRSPHTALRSRHHHHRTPSPSPVPSQAGCQTRAQQSVPAALLPSKSVPPLPGDHRASGEPQRPHGRCWKRGEEEGLGSADRWVTRVQFTRREGDRGDGAGVPVPAPAALPSAREGARAPRPTSLAQPQLQRLPLLLSPTSPAPRARRPG